MSINVDLISLLNHPGVDQNFLLKHKDNNQPTPNKIPPELVEAYQMGQILIKCLKMFGESQRKLAALSKEDSEKYTQLHQALKDAMLQSSDKESSALKLIVESNKENTKDQDFTYRISYTPI